MCRLRCIPAYDVPSCLLFVASVRSNIAPLVCSFRRLQCWVSWVVLVLVGCMASVPETMAFERCNVLFASTVAKELMPYAMTRPVVMVITSAPIHSDASFPANATAPIVLDPLLALSVTLRRPHPS